MKVQRLSSLRNARLPRSGRGCPLYVLAFMVLGVMGSPAFSQDVVDIDTDGDGAPDAAERFHGTSVEDPDTDGDGINDAIELTLACPCNPFVVDSDEDGICDGPVSFDSCTGRPEGAPPCERLSETGSYVLSGSGCSKTPPSTSIGFCLLGFLLLAFQRRRSPKRIAPSSLPGEHVETSSTCRTDSRRRRS